MRDLIRTLTAPAAHPTVPELTLQLATELTPLWSATEALLQQQNMAPPYWAFAWPGSVGLARYLLDHPELVAGKRVIDVGAGCGVAALAAARSGARATAVEVDRLAGEAIAMNAAQNGLDVAVVVADLLDGDPPEAELFVVGDLCYDAPLTARLLGFLRRAQAQGAEVWVGDPGRTFLPSGLEALAAYEVDTLRELETHGRCVTRVMRLLPA